MFEGKPRKMVMQASGNGYFCVLDRTNGAQLLTMKFSDAAKWAEGINAKGQLVRNPEKDNTIAGSVVSPDTGGATNWYPPSYDAQTGLFYVVLREVYAMYYLTSKDPRMIMGLGGSEQDVVGSLGTSIAAIDYHTGKLAWKYRFEGSAGGVGGGPRFLPTTGRLLFSHEGGGGLVVFVLLGAQPPAPPWPHPLSPLPDHAPPPHHA